MDALFPPGPQKHLLLGNSVEFRHDPLTAMVDAARSYGEIVHFRFGPSHAYLVTSADHVHYILSERPDLFDVQHHFYRAIQSAFGHELFAPDDGVCKRPKSPPPLPRNWLQTHAASITNAGLETVAGWENGDVIDLDQELQELTLRIAAAAVFGSELNAAMRQFAAHAPHSHTMHDRRFTSPWSLRLPASDRAQDAAVQRIRADGSQPRRRDALSLLGLMPLSEHQMGAELVRLFTLMHGTAATTLMWALVLLGQNREISDLLHDELDTVLGDRTPTADDLPDLAYTEMVLRETMRLYPPAWLISRQSRKEARIGSFFVPAGSTILCSPYIMQRSPRNFVEPEKFLPERFGVGYEKRTRRYAYAPFGVSAPLEEATLLTETKLLLPILARRFNFVQEVSRSVEIDPLVTLRPKNGLPIQVQTRMVHTAEVM